MNQHSRTAGRRARWLVSILLAAIPRGAPGDLPLESVALFTSGVGYWERGGEIDGPTRIEWPFRLDQVPDVIKSLVVMDPAGGAVTVTAESRDPIERLLQAFRLDLSDHPPLAVLLGRARGARARIQAGALDLTGTVMGIEPHTVRDTATDTVREEWTLTLLDEGRLHRVALEAVQSIEFLDAAVRDDLEAALAALGGNLARDRRSVQVDLAGNGVRTVRVGYVMEAPVWKTSYRLVLSKEDPPYLQGWAHVENMTDEDWEGVRLSLISGRPLSFIQNLYDPVYMERPIVEHDRRAGIAPPVYDAVLAEVPVDAPPAPRRMVGRMAARGGADLAHEEAGAAAPAAFQRERERGAELRDGVAEQAAAEEAGELFAYQVEAPVWLPRRRSAMLPIVSRAVVGHSLSIFDASVNAQRALNGVEVDNTTGLFLMGGPITVFEDGTYAGDARLADTPKGETRLLSFALDTASEIRVDRMGGEEAVLSIRIVNGVLQVQRKLVERTAYTLHNRRDRDRAYLIAHPRRDGWDLVEPEISESTPTRHRIRATVDAGGSHVVTARTERVVREATAVTSLRERQLLLYIEQRTLSPAVREALEVVVRRQAELQDLRRQREEAERAQQTIIAEQGRLRENMRVVERRSASFAMWEKQLVDQEDELAALRADVQRLRAREADVTRELQDFLSQLTVE